MNFINMEQERREITYQDILRMKELLDKQNVPRPRIIRIPHSSIGYFANRYLGDKLSEGVKRLFIKKFIKEAKTTFKI